jgi:small subunit ribosomal protein S20
MFWRNELANIKSQIKRNRQNEKRRVRNRVYVGSARTYIKKARQAIDSAKTGGNEEDAREATLKAISALDKAAEKGILHKNNVARRKSRLMKRLNALGK